VISSQSGGAAATDEAPGDAPVYKERIPAKYNVQSELKAEVKGGAENVFDFKLE
jgi:hypothetical protein